MLLPTMTHLHIPFQRIAALIGRLLCERISIVTGRFWRAVTSTAMAKFLSKEITKKTISEILTSQIRISIRQTSLRMLRWSTWKTLSLKIKNLFSFTWHITPHTFPLKPLMKSLPSMKLILRMPSGSQHGVADGMICDRKNLSGKRNLVLFLSNSSFPLWTHFIISQSCLACRPEQNSFICQRGMIFRTM